MNREEADRPTARSPAAAHASRWSSRTRRSSPDAAQLAQQDPTWDAGRWGGKGSLWYHHVYMPAQNPGDPSGMSAFGRWMYGPWFWPPATPRSTGRSRTRTTTRPATRRPGHVAVPDRPVLRAGADPRHAEHLGRHGAVQRHPDRQRHGLPEDDGGAEGVPLPDAERGQRPLLQPPVVRRRPDHRHRARSR